MILSRGGDVEGGRDGILRHGCGIEGQLSVILRLGCDVHPLTDIFFGSFVKAPKPETLNPEG